MFEAVADIAAASPIVGLIIGVVCCGVGSYLQWGNPKLMMGMAPIVGVCFNIVGLLSIVVAILYFLKGLLSFRPSFRRFSPTSPGRKNQSATPLLDIWTLERVQSHSWMEFESLVAHLFREQGYVVEERGRTAARNRSGDGGVDLVLSHPKAPGASYLVQCKQYRVWDVGEPKVREFFGAMADWKTNCEGIIITCGRFSGPAREFAAGKPIRLVDGEGLLRMLNAGNPVRPKVTIPAPPGVQTVSTPPPADRVRTPASAPPVCPRCGSTMVRRVAAHGNWKGRPFWGCSTYPRCSEKINIG